MNMMVEQLLRKKIVKLQKELRAREKELLMDYEAHLDSLVPYDKGWINGKMAMCRVMQVAIKRIVKEYENEQAKKEILP